MGTGNGNGKPTTPEREVRLAVPEGMNPQVAEMIFRQMLAELNDMEPLMPPQLKEIASQGVLNDMPKFVVIRRMIEEAPAGSHWGITIADSQAVLMPGGTGNQIYIDACCKMRDAKVEGINRVISTLTCFALMTSGAARGLLAMHGIGMKIQHPYIPEVEEKSEDGEAEG